MKATTKFDLGQTVFFVNKKDGVIKGEVTSIDVHIRHKLLSPLIMYHVTQPKKIGFDVLFEREVFATKQELLANITQLNTKNNDK